MTWLEIKGILDILQTLVVPVLTYGLYRLARIDDALGDIREHLAKLNGKVGTCDALRVAHEESDERLHDQCEQQLEIVQRKLMGTP